MKICYLFTAEMVTWAIFSVESAPLLLQGSTVTSSSSAFIFNLNIDADLNAMFSYFKLVLEILGLPFSKNFEKVTKGGSPTQKHPNASEW